MKKILIFSQILIIHLVSSAENPCKISQSLCHNSGYCNWYGEKNYTCTCVPGYMGKKCGYEIDFCSESNNLCQNNSTCSQHISENPLDNSKYFKCNCKYPFQGQYCESISKFISIKNVIISKRSQAQATTRNTSVSSIFTDRFLPRIENFWRARGAVKIDYLGKRFESEKEIIHGLFALQLVAPEDKNTSQRNVGTYSRQNINFDEGMEEFLELINQEADDEDENITITTGEETSAIDDTITDEVIEEIDICKTGFPDSSPGNCINGECYSEIDSISKQNVAFCQCFSGFEGEFCENIINYCEDDPCGNGEECQNNIDGYFCSRQETSFCQDDPCENGVVCENDACDCSQSTLFESSFLSGTFCEILSGCEIENTCEEGFVCVDESDGPVCVEETTTSSTLPITTSVLTTLEVTTEVTTETVTTKTTNEETTTKATLPITTSVLTTLEITTDDLVTTENTTEETTTKATTVSVILNTNCTCENGTPYDISDWKKCEFLDDFGQPKKHVCKACDQYYHLDGAACTDCVNFIVNLGHGVCQPNICYGLEGNSTIVVDDKTCLEHGSVEAATTEAATSEAVTTIAVTTEAATTVAATTEAVAIEAVTTETATTETATTEAATTEAITTEAAATIAVNTEAATAEAAITKAVTTKIVTTEEVITEAATTEATTIEAVTTIAVTTAAATTKAATTEAVVTEAVTTETATTEAATTKAITTEAAATIAVNTEAATAEAAITKAVTTKIVTTEEVITEAATTEATTIEAVTSEAVIIKATTTEATTEAATIEAVTTEEIIIPVTSAIIITTKKATTTTIPEFTPKLPTAVTPIEIVPQIFTDPVTVKGGV